MFVYVNVCYLSYCFSRCILLELKGNSYEEVKQLEIKNNNRITSFFCKKKYQQFKSTYKE
jgi:hypothetical protein